MEKTVISLGGSLIAQKAGIDTEYLQQFGSLIRTYAQFKRHQFFIVCGGGNLARTYIETATELSGGNISTNDKDWIGIQATRANAHLVKSLFNGQVNPEVISNPNTNLKGKNYPITLASGYRPGNSTDAIAVRLAHKNRIKRVINEIPNRSKLRGIR